MVSAVYVYIIIGMTYYYLNTEKIVYILCVKPNLFADFMRLLYYY